MGFFKTTGGKIAPYVLAFGTTAIGAAILGGCPTPVTPEPPVNNPPTLATMPEIHVTEGQTLELVIPATDPDGDALTVTFPEAPPWLAAPEAGALNIGVVVPQVDIDVSEPLTVEVSDGTDTVSQSLSVITMDSESRDIIKSAADRLITLQNVNGSWDWDVTNATGPSVDYYNIAGVTGEGLIDAFNLTGNVKYLDAARRAGDYIVDTPLSTTTRQNAFNIVFLQRLKNTSGDVKYETKANEILNHFLHDNNFWTVGANDVDVDGTTGLSAQELLNAYKKYRSAEVNPQGIVPWDLFHFIRAAKTKGGESVLVSDMPGVLAAYVNQPGFVDFIGNYALGLAATVIGLKNGGANYTSVLERLVAKQQANGSVGNSGDGLVQTTAYAAMAFSDVGDRARLGSAVNYLKANFGYDGPGGVLLHGWKQTDNLTEYSETNSEAISALTDSLLVLEHPAQPF